MAGKVAAEKAEHLSSRIRRAVADHEAGRLEAAERGYRNVLKAAPESFDALHLLGVLAHQTGRNTEAIALIGRALSVSDGVAEAHFNYAAALQATGQVEQATVALRRAIERRPNYSQAHLNLGVLLRAQGKLAEAEAAYRRAISSQPDFATAHNNLGSLLEVLGRFEEAIVCWRTAIDIKPDYAEAYRNLAQHDASALSHRHVTTMERLVAEARQPEKELVYLCFALAEVYEAHDAYDAAFAALRRGNGIRRRCLDYSIEAERAIAASMAENFGAATLERGRKHGCPSDLPILIVGMPRAGTSLVEQILASHSWVFGAGELTVIGDLARPYVKQWDGRPKWDWDPEDETLGRLGETYVAKLRALAPNARHVVDKMPHNFLFLGFAGAILPQAKIIHVRRDPVDTCLACYKRLFNAGQRFSYDLAELGAYYRMYDELMDHWSSVMPGVILEVAYEELVANPRATIQMMLAHCGLPWEESCLAFHRTERPVRTASAAQVRQPLYASAVGRWKHYERHLGPLIEALGPLAAPGS